MPTDTVQTKRRATYADLLRVPDTMVAEIIDGELVVSPRPATPHAFAATEMAGDLVPAFHGTEARSGPGGWWILPEPELHLTDDVLVPDLAARVIAGRSSPRTRRTRWRRWIHLRQSRSGSVGGGCPPSQPSAADVTSASIRTMSFSMSRMSASISSSGRGDVVPQVGREVGRVAEELLEVVAGRVVEREARRLAQLRVQVLELLLPQLGLPGEHLRLRRRE